MLQYHFFDTVDTITTNLVIPGRVTDWENITGFSHIFIFHSSCCAMDRNGSVNIIFFDNIIFTIFFHILHFGQKPGRKIIPISNLTSQRHQSRQQKTKKVFTEKLKISSLRLRSYSSWSLHADIFCSRTPSVQYSLRRIHYGIGCIHFQRLRCRWSAHNNLERIKWWREIEKKWREKFSRSHCVIMIESETLYQYRTNCKEVGFEPKKIQRHGSKLR